MTITTEWNMTDEEWLEHIRRVLPKHDPEQCEALSGQSWSTRVIQCSAKRGHEGRHRYEWD
jgi:hypothetical protein